MKIRIINLYLHNKVNSFIKHNQLYYENYNEKNVNIH